jgi:hypothetical protein
VKAELDSLPPDAPGADVSALEQRIHAMLFADAVEGAVHEKAHA